MPNQNANGRISELRDISNVKRTRNPKNTSKPSRNPRNTWKPTTTQGLHGPCPFTKLFPRNSNLHRRTGRKPDGKFMSKYKNVPIAPGRLLLSRKGEHISEFHDLVGDRDVRTRIAKSPLKLQPKSDAIIFPEELQHLLRSILFSTVCGFKLPNDVAETILEFMSTRLIAKGYYKIMNRVAKMTTFDRKLCLSPPNEDGICEYKDLMSVKEDVGYGGTVIYCETLGRYTYNPETQRIVFDAKICHGNSRKNGNDFYLETHTVNGAVSGSILHADYTGTDLRGSTAFWTAWAPTELIPFNEVEAELAQLAKSQYSGAQKDLQCDASTPVCSEDEDSNWE